jgi:hypothetical protein
MKAMIPEKEIDLDCCSKMANERGNQGVETVWARGFPWARVSISSPVVLVFDLLRVAELALSVTYNRRLS